MPFPDASTAIVDDEVGDEADITAEEMDSRFNDVFDPNITNPNAFGDL